MDGERPEDALSDDALDRELEAALRVEPSPEFLARVRTRVAAEPVGPAWRWWTLLASGSLAGATLILLIAVWSPRAVTDRPDIATSPASESVAESSAPPRGLADAPAPRVASEPRALFAARPTRSAQRLAPAPVGSATTPAAMDYEPPFAEVIVSAEQQRALAAILALLQGGERPVLPSPTDRDAGTEAIPALEIESIIIEEVAIVALLDEGGRQ